MTPADDIVESLILEAEAVNADIAAAWILAEGKVPDWFGLHDEMEHGWLGRNFFDQRHRYPESPERNPNYPERPVQKGSCLIGIATVPGGKGPSGSQIISRKAWALVGDKLVIVPLREHRWYGV